MVHTHARTHNHFTALLDFVRDYPDRLPGQNPDVKPGR